MSNLYRGPSIDAPYQVSVHLAKQFQMRRVKCEKLVTIHVKWWRKLTWPLARWAKDTNVQTMIYSTPHIKPKSEEHEPR